MASERLPSRPACLLVASGAAEGVSAQSFLHCFTLASAAFSLQVATPGGKPMDFVDVNESNARWVQDFRLKAYASPAKLESIDGARYHALLIPSCPGALVDLASSGSLARILQHFHSESKPICAVGHGVAALCCATSEDRSWVFQGYSVTGPSVYELVRAPGFAHLPLVVEDFVKDAGACFSGSEQAPSRCRHLQMSWVSPETLPHDTRPAWPLVELLGALRILPEGLQTPAGLRTLGLGPLTSHPVCGTSWRWT
ncbi:glutamine amidotransferase-like class 1 domain-containing protein 1 isoform X2 [Budorcas taxicolor]|uniref:glutamine amidotransferase-like class 1 domain-containing protein 1 isoform X2 n=1 Tax=Budorcas taxicolor TaxID=37181 RepID=UPI002284CCE4|nr:glutamine amidotransferase-like class 1 domain-containing protein 1 isoform X2 [Budorcas taxicolor]